MGIILNYKGWKKVYESANGQLGSNELAPIPVSPGSSQKHTLNPIAAKAYAEMVAAAAKDGIVWGITDSYRTLDVQKDLVARKGLYSQGGLAAAPGTSNHGWGSAVDLKVKRETKEHSWLINNAAKFGFSTIPREPWHWEHKASAAAIKSGQRPTSRQPEGQSSSSFSGASSLQYGAKGNDVSTLQSKLINLNYSLPVHGIDGTFGPETKQAVEQFQKQNRLPVTGVVTKEVMDLLNSGRALGLLDPATSREARRPGQLTLTGNFDDTQKRNINLMIDYMNKSGITDPLAQIGILSVISKESGFKPKSEHSYANTANSRIRSIFGSRVAGYSDSELEALKKDPEAFFNVVYAKTVGNQGGGDGWKYRGRGFNQLTGKKNYEKYGNLIGIDLVNNPDRVNDPQVAAKVAIKFFTKDKPSTTFPKFKDKAEAASYFADINAGGKAGSHREKAIAAAEKFEVSTNLA